MAIQFHELPVDVFPEASRPYIKRLNLELRELFGLEGVLRNPVSTRRSDLSIVRRAEVQVDQTRITPTIVSGGGSASDAGTPAITFGLANVVGGQTTFVSTNSSLALFNTTVPIGVSTGSSTGSAAFAARRDHVHALDFGTFAFDASLPANLADSAAAGTSGSASRGDHVHQYPPSLRASGSSLTLADSGVNQTLTGNLGSLTLTMPGAATVGLRVTSSASPVADVCIIDGDFDNNNGLIRAEWAGGDLTSETVRCWDARYAVSGVWGTATIIGFDNSTFALTPTAGTTASKAYCAHLNGPSIQNATGQWTEVASLFIEAPRRSLANPSIASAESIVAECPTISGTTQIGLYLKQRAAQQVATNRIGILVDAQNSGTNRWGAYIGNRVYIESPAGQTNTVLSLTQLETGAVAGAHVNLNDKAGDPPAPVAGDIWRNGDSLNFRQAAATVDLTAAGAGGDNVSVNGSAASDADFDDAFPVAPGNFMNVRWQKGSSSPNDISAYIGKDVNGNTMLTFSATVSADRYIQFTNSTNASGIGPAIDAEGNGADIDLNLYPKGAGIIGAANGLIFGSRATPAIPGTSYCTLFAKPEDGQGRLVTHDATGQVNNIAYLMRISGDSGTAGPHMTWQTLTSSAVTGSTTPGTIMTTNGVTNGTWKFKYTLLYGSSSGTAGIGFGIGHDGTVSRVAFNWQHVTTGGAVTTGVGDDIVGATAGQMVEGKAERTLSTISSTSDGVATNDVPILAILEGLAVVTAGGSLILLARTETAGSTVSVMAGSCMELLKIA